MPWARPPFSPLLNTSLCTVQSGPIQNMANHAGTCYRALQSIKGRADSDHIHKFRVSLVLKIWLASHFGPCEDFYAFPLCPGSLELPAPSLGTEGTSTWAMMGQARDLELKSLIPPEAKAYLPDLVGVLPRMLRSPGSLAPPNQLLAPTSTRVLEPCRWLGIALSVSSNTWAPLNSQKITAMPRGQSERYLTSKARRWQ